MAAQREKWPRLEGVSPPAAPAQRECGRANKPDHRAALRQIKMISPRRLPANYHDRPHTGEAAAEAAAEHGIHLAVVKLPAAKKGFVLLPRRWVVERSFAWAARFRRLAR